MNTFINISGKFKLKSNPNKSKGFNKPYNIITSNIKKNSIMLSWNHDSKDKNITFIINKMKMIII